MTTNKPEDLKVHMAKSVKPAPGNRMVVRTLCGRKGDQMSDARPAGRAKVKLDTGSEVECMGVGFHWQEVTCVACRRAMKLDTLQKEYSADKPKLPAPLATMVASHMDEAMITLIYEALRWASFCVGEGLCINASMKPGDPGYNTDAIDPDDIFFNFVEAFSRGIEYEDIPAVVVKRLKEVMPAQLKYYPTIINYVDEAHKEKLIRWFGTGPTYVKFN